jgi:hypothetical protein
MDNLARVLGGTTPIPRGVAFCQGLAHFGHSAEYRLAQVGQDMKLTVGGVHRQRLQRERVIQGRAIGRDTFDYELSGFQHCTPFNNGYVKHQSNGTWDAPNACLLRLLTLTSRPVSNSPNV